MLSYQALLKQLAEGKYSSVYLFFGDEKYLQEELVNRLAASYLEADNSFGREKLDGKAHDLEELISRLNERGLFSKRRLLIVDNPPYLAPPGKKADHESAEEDEEVSRDQKPGANLLSSYIEQQESPVPDSILVFLSPGADRRKRLYKLIDKKGTVVECSALRGEALASWIQKKAKRLGKKIDRKAVEQLLLAGDQNLHYLSNELEKYCIYLGEEHDTITVDTVDKLFSGDLHGNVFKLADALAEGNLDKAQEYLELLLRRREQPLLIFFMLVRHYRLLLQAKSLLEEGYEGADLTSSLGVHPFVARKLKEQAVIYNKHILEEAIIALQKVDFQIKTGLIDPPEALKLILSRIDYVQSTAHKEIL